MSSGPSVAQRVMSAPTQKALGPLPVRIATRTAGLRSISSATRSSRSSISGVRAPNFSGRFNVMRATAPSISRTTRSSVLWISTMPLLQELEAERLRPEQGLVHDPQVGGHAKFEAGAAEDIPLQIDPRCDLGDDQPLRG